MRAVEFESTVAPGGKIALPPDVAAEIAAGEQIRIVLMWDPDDAKGAWRTVAGQRFLETYAPEDDIYEQLANDPSIR